jgi:uncharacterized protein YkwD
MKTTVTFSFLLAALLGLSCTKGEVSNDTVVNTEPLSTVPTTVNKTVMLQLINSVRQKGCQCGDTYYNPAPSLTWNNQLEAAAYVHSEDMYTNKYFNHTAPDGSNGGVRIEQAGYNWTTFGENIAMGYKSEKEVLDGWLQSPGHCKNIMNKSFKEMGVARVGTYWTQEFGAKSNQ